MAKRSARTSSIWHSRQHVLKTANPATRTSARTCRKQKTLFVLRSLHHGCPSSHRSLGLQVRGVSFVEDRTGLTILRNNVSILRYLLGSSEPFENFYAKAKRHRIPALHCLDLFLPSLWSSFYDAYHLKGSLQKAQARLTLTPLRSRKRLFRLIAEAWEEQSVSKPLSGPFSGVAIKFRLCWLPA